MDTGFAKTISTEPLSNSDDQADMCAVTRIDTDGPYFGRQ